MSVSSKTHDVAKNTLDLLWARVRQRGDLPGFSKVISAILGAMRGEDDREFNMTRTVLSDPALTQKVLRLANSPMYSVFGRGINTVSKAVIVLGTEAIGHLALGLKLIDGLSGASVDSPKARAEMEKAVMAGNIARQIASSATTRDAEEAVVCSMLHSLGRMMVTFYLPDRWLLVQARSAELADDESAAARDVLGLGLDELGKAIAQHWGLPASLINTLHDMHPNPTGEPLDHADWLAALSTMSSRCAAILHDDRPSAAQELSRITDSYAEMIGLDAQQVLAAVETAKSSLQEETALARPARQEDAIKPAGKPANAMQLLVNGVADMRGVASTLSTGQLLTMALETVFNGFGFSRAIAFLRNQDHGRYMARMCFGDGVQELLPHLVFSDAYQPDVFHAALANDKMIFVEKAQDSQFSSKLPRWWKDMFTTSRSFVVLPLTVNRQPVGFIYGDWDESLPIAKIEASEIPPLDELRLLVVHAIEQRRRLESSTAHSGFW